MREIVLDTETTGLNPDKGDRIVEIGAIELINHIPTGNTFHCYLNPLLEGEMPSESFKVHGLSLYFWKHFISFETSMNYLTKRRRYLKKRSRLKFSGSNYSNHYKVLTKFENKMCENN